MVLSHLGRSRYSPRSRSQGKFSISGAYFLAVRQAQRRGNSPLRSGAGSQGVTTPDDAADVLMTPALEAETERLLSQRTRDIRFSPEMVRTYRTKDWPQRSKIARAWMIWVALISMAFVPISYLLAPNYLVLTTIISGLL